MIYDAIKRNKGIKKKEKENNNNNNKIKKIKSIKVNKKKGQTDGGVRRAWEIDFNFLFFFSSLLSQIYENRTTGFRRG